jgi:hypothetical protein
MSDTNAGIVDKLITVDMKLWTVQESVQDIKRMTYEQFMARYILGSDSRLLYDTIVKVCDLNVQRSMLVDELDTQLIDLAQSAAKGEDLTRFRQLKHKTLQVKPYGT